MCTGCIAHLTTIGVYTSHNVTLIWDVESFWWFNPFCILQCFSFLWVLISKHEKYTIGIKPRIYCTYFYIRWWAVLLVWHKMNQSAHFIVNLSVSYTISTNQIFLFWNERNYNENGQMVDLNITFHKFEIREWKYMLLVN